MEKSELNSFARRLRYAREELRKLKQSELAEKANIPATSISHFENEEGKRKPSFDNLQSLAKALDVTTDFLLGRTDDPCGNTALDEQLYRDVKNLSEADKAMAEALIKQLAERRQ
ncbi:helix-turn-helix transcriptional regulator [Glaciimonas sp. CA11.2]|uniref:helix-turn-helix domain-containing protein n=1 Tax=Glaciimonas sp. CA11.2 TaxID=3048601 RepID=UPI002AB36396|nr:helix-turn-helix transcriptional regulator [Glaciimonas sp. CA11.2]MDY7545033.1 helix-turn-helix transcriptional regulator [Glaciimonas sp. CA11.2]